MQWIGCGCQEHDPMKSRWSGEWPGVAECRELGFWCVELGGRFWPCAPDYPGATEDLNRLTRLHAMGYDVYADCDVLRRASDEM